MAPRDDLPPGFTVDDLPPGFAVDDEEQDPSALDKFGSRLGSNLRGLPYGMLDSTILTPFRTLTNFPSSYREITDEYPGIEAMPFASLPLAGGDAFLDAATRNVPEADKGRAKRGVMSAIGGGALGGLGGGAWLGPWGALGGAVLGGVTAPFAVDQIEQAVGSAPDTPIGDDLINYGADLTTGAITAPALKYGSGVASRRIAAPMARGGFGLSEWMNRLRDQGVLRAGALSMKPDDQTIRAPRSLREVQDNFAFLTNPDEANNLPAIDGKETIPLPAPEQAALPAPDDNLPAVSNGTSPSTDVADNGTTIHAQIPGNRTSGAAPSGPRPVNIRPTVGHRQDYYLNQAVKEVPEFFDYQRDPSQPEFKQLADNVRGHMDINNQTVDTILSELPPEANQPVQSGLFGRIVELASEKMDPFGTRKPYRDVAVAEIEKFASRLLPNPEEAQEFRNLFKKNRTFQDGGSTELTDAEMLRLQELTDKAGNVMLTPMELRGLKTEYDKLGKWQSMSISGSSDERAAAMRKDAYREIANNIRDTLEKTVAEFAPDRLRDYTTANRKMYLGGKMLPMAEERMSQQATFGRRIQDPSLVNPRVWDTPILGGVAKWASGIASPQIFDPEARLYSADPNTFNFGTRGGSASPSNIARMSGEAVGNVGAGANKWLETISNSPALRGTMATTQMAGQPEPSPSEEGGFWDKTVKPAIKAVGDFFVPRADAQEFMPSADGMPQPQLLPRDTEHLSSEALGDFLMKTAQTPQAMIAQQLVAKLQKAHHAQDIDTIEKIHSDMTRLFPDLFEPGVGVNGKIFYPDEQEKVMEKLKQLQRMGKIDPEFLAHQRNAFNNPEDGRVLPIDESVFGKGSGSRKNKFHDGTRVYSY